jgi:hypothetical protein
MPPVRVAAERLAGKGLTISWTVPRCVCVTESSRVNVQVELLQTDGIHDVRHEAHDSMLNCSLMIQWVDPDNQ